MDRSECVSKDSERMEDGRLIQLDPESSRCRQRGHLWPEPLQGGSEVAAGKGDPGHCPRFTLLGGCFPGPASSAGRTRRPVQLLKEPKLTVGRPG